MSNNNQRPVYHRNPEGNGKAMAWIIGLIFGALFLFWPLFLESVVIKVTVQLLWVAGLILFVLLARGHNTVPGSRDRRKYPVPEDWCSKHGMPRVSCPCRKVLSSSPQEQHQEAGDPGCYRCHRVGGPALLLAEERDPPDDHHQEQDTQDCSHYPHFISIFRRGTDPTLPRHRLGDQR